MLYGELLDICVTVIAMVHSNEMQNLVHVMSSKCLKRQNVHLLYDNGRSRVAKMTRQRALELGENVLPHPENSSDLEPSDYHLFDDQHYTEM